MIIIVGIVVVSVAIIGAILLIDQSKQIVMVKNQMMLDDELSWCEKEYVSDIAAMDRCVLSAFETFGTQDQLSNYIHVKMK